MRPARPRSRLLRLRRSAVVFAVLALVAFAVDWKICDETLVGQEEGPALRNLD